MFLILYPEQANKRKLEEVARPNRGSVNLKGLNWKVNCFLLLLAPLEGTQIMLSQLFLSQRYSFLH